MECKDKNCPSHGTLATRGAVLDGTVVSDKMENSVVVKRDRFVKVKKYDRFKRSTSKIPAHNPPCINAKVGDIVWIMECRKLSKTVSFVVIEILGDKNAKVEKEQVAPKAKSKVKAKPKAKKIKEVVNG